MTERTGDAEGPRHDFGRTSDRTYDVAGTLRLFDETPMPDPDLGRVTAESLPVGSGEPAVGICCSGGGIRSAAYNLGALQVLSERKGDGSSVLGQARYLSAVSGGAYIAGAFAIASRYSDADLLAEDPAFAPGSPEVDFVRNRCSYLAADLGGRIRLFAAVIVGFISNAIFLGLAIAVLAWPLGSAYAGNGSKAFWSWAWPVPTVLLAVAGHRWSRASRRLARLPHGVNADAERQELADLADERHKLEKDRQRYRLVSLTFGGVVAVLAGVFLWPPVDETASGGLGVDPFGWAMGGALVVLGLCGAVFARMFRPKSAIEGPVIDAAGGLIVLGLVLITVRWLIPVLVVGTEAAADATDEHGATQTGVISVVAIIGATISQVGGFLRETNSLRQEFAGSAKEAKNGSDAEKPSRPARIGQTAHRALIGVVGGLIGPVLLVGVFLLVVKVAVRFEDGEVWRWAVWIGLAVALAVVYGFADLTSWSMHPFYKRRLASAFCVRRTRDAWTQTVARECPWSFQIRLSDLDQKKMRTPFPELILCCAASVSDGGSTPPGSGVTSFVFTPTEVGGPLVGGIDTTTLERSLKPRRRRNITVPAALAMSGAALSPSMGKFTTLPRRFLLTLGNVRLGVWTPNPRTVECWQEEDVDVPADGSYGTDQDPGGSPSGLKRHLMASSPKPNLLAHELFGWHRLNDTFLYVTDGGHYENLGLVELLRRRCTTIYCFDAAGGEVASYATLGEAIALARAELRVEITIDPTSMRPADAERLYPAQCVRGSIVYPPDERGISLAGRLFYAKAGVTRDAPWDVRAYYEKDRRFPTHSTFDQLYSGERFEAYRVLGAGAARTMLREKQESEKVLRLDDATMAQARSAFQDRSVDLTDGSTAASRGAG